MSINCFECGKEYRELSEFGELRSLGLALKGLCRCGQWIPANRLWRARERLAIQPEPEPEMRSQTLRSAQQLSLFAVSN